MELVLQTYALTKHFGPVRAMDTAASLQSSCL